MRLTGSALLTRGADSSAFVAASLHVTNLADSTQRVWYGDAPCIPPLLVQIRDATGARAVWNAVDAYRDTFCHAVRHYVDIAPGQTWDYRLNIPVKDILGDSLPRATYVVTGSAKWLEPGFANELVLGQLLIER
jgi:hypothetical protein